MLSVFLAYEPEDDALALLRERLLPAVDLKVGPDLPDPPDYQVLVAGRPEPEHLVASEVLHTLVVPWAGVPVETREKVRAVPGLSIHNLHHNAAPVAELALALLLAAAKMIVPYDQSLRRYDWSPRYRESQELLLHGKKALILGYGAIGRRVAPVLRGLGMEVTATRRSLITVEQEGEVTVYPGAQTKELLPRAHALIITLPLTTETRGLLGEKELSRLPDGSVLVNVGRAEIVDQSALYEALRSGPLRAAGLDVWYNYPPDPESRSHTQPADLPFHELENVVMSPHRGGSTDETSRLRMIHLAALLNAAARGEPMPNRIDLDKGY